MNAKKIITVSSKVFIGFSIFSLGYVSILSLIDPQATMSLVATNLPNTDALSSIRGIYGGVAFVICLQLVYLLLKDPKKGLLFLIFFWGAYALSRLITIIVDGPLGDFGNQWIMTETTLSVLALILYLLFKKHGTPVNQ